MDLKTIWPMIYEIRGQKIMLDFNLAELYATQTRILKQAVRRNMQRFPPDFLIELTRKEFQSLRSQIVTLKTGKGQHSKYLPFAFTEQGVAMLASILNSPMAIEVNIAIVRAFVYIRQYSLSHKDLTEKLKELESRYDKQFKDVYEAINFLLQKDKNESEQKSRKRIGFRQNKEEMQ